MVMREACSEEVDEIILDTSYGVHRTQQILQNWNMNKNIEVNVYKGSETLLVASGIVKEIKAALQTKVNLPSGGYLFIQTTEALTVIDVNSGKFVSSTTQDETILKTNLEAVHEIARQLRLRNIGGMVIVDFIDMNNRRDKLAMMEELEIALEKDKAKPQVGQLSDLGLVELTRHRQGQSLEEIFGKKCPHCQGSGHIADDLNFSAPVLEGEIKAKAAKLKIPAQQLKNKTPNYKQNKVFNNPNNNPLSDENNQQNNNQQNGNQYNNKKFNKFNKHNNQNNQNAEQPSISIEEIQEIQAENQITPVQETLKTDEQRIETPVETSVDVSENQKTDDVKKEEKKEKKPRKTTGRKKQTPKVENKEIKEEVTIAENQTPIKEEKKGTAKKKPVRKPRKPKKAENNTEINE